MQTSIPQTDDKTQVVNKCQDGSAAVIFAKTEAVSSAEAAYRAAYAAYEAYNEACKAASDRMDEALRVREAAYDAFDAFSAKMTKAKPSTRRYMAATYEAVKTAAERAATAWADARDAHMSASNTLDTALAVRIEMRRALDAAREACLGGDAQ